MCGIVGAVANRNVVEILIAGLRALEYRGYDSAGICVQSENDLERLRTAGKVAELEKLQRDAKLSAPIGIAHTRWATHGSPTAGNAHPIISRGNVAVVHNGIIENHEELKAELTELGYEFESETDTEVIAHLVEYRMSEGDDLREAVIASIKRLHGAFAIAVLDRRDPDRILGARLGSPLVAGLGFDENFLASDSQALLPVTNRFIYLEDGDVVEVRRDAVAVFDTSGKAVKRPVKESELSAEAVDRGKYRHFMLKEIFEQATSVSETLQGRIAVDPARPLLGKQIEELLKPARAIQIIACGTSFHAGLVARHWFESFAGIPCAVEVASEYRYRTAVVPPDCLFVTISQSGETADTLAALRLAKERGFIGSLAICNVPESSLVRESDAAFMTRAGPEIGVASTKAFTTQLTALALVALQKALQEGVDPSAVATHCAELEGLPSALKSALELDPEIEALAGAFGPKRHALFLGRGIHYPIAMEGALKLKEISYIHAEAYPAGELKHGPLALVDEAMPVIAVAPGDDLLEKLKSNMAEVRARGGELFVIADAESAGDIRLDRGHILTVQHSADFISPIVMTIPLQLLAYHVAVIKGTDVDKPRNLAKSVTVE
ncbi:MAG: glutamine--fructose-6-phosphate transaminase (isomerizing) [Xanthomonadales bacterium]|nr:glutamine--fructose-6-phosphate transaminase (isomerizing) [Xanthomonadales bacterium]